MNNSKGQSATEFILALPWLCAALLAFVLFVIFGVRAQTATYAGFMAARVYSVWPEEMPQLAKGRRDMAAAELKWLLPNTGIDFQESNGALEVNSSNLATRTPVVFEPARACVYEDNALPTAMQEACQ